MLRKFRNLGLKFWKNRLAQNHRFLSNFIEPILSIGTDQSIHVGKSQNLSLLKISEIGTIHVPRFQHRKGEKRASQRR